VALWRVVRQADKDAAAAAAAGSPKAEGDAKPKGEAAKSTWLCCFVLLETSVAQSCLR
jgi:hypothetical protein